jgi:predicted small metal-binding protein
MAKVIRCKDAGFECDAVIKGETEDEALKEAAAHAKEFRGPEEVTPEVADKVRSIMRDED